MSTEILLEYEEMLEKFWGPVVTSHVMETIENLPNIDLVTVYYKWQVIPQGVSPINYTIDIQLFIFLF